MKVAAINQVLTFPCHSEAVSLFKKTKERIHYIALGIFAALVEIPLVDFVYERVANLLKRGGLDVSQPQDAAAIFNVAKKVKYGFLALAFKVALVSYVVIFGPILEERIFRDRLHHWLRSKFKDPDSGASKVARVALNGLIFGVCHFSPFQSWNNIPLMAAISLSGCMLAALREATGNLTASTATHIVANALASFALLKPNLSPILAR